MSTYHSFCMEIEFMFRKVLKVETSHGIISADSLEAKGCLNSTVTKYLEMVAVKYGNNSMNVVNKIDEFTCSHDTDLKFIGVEDYTDEHTRYLNDLRELIEYIKNGAS